jgi:hypothetical protein
MSIWGIVGEIGTGKTYTAVREAIELAEKRQKKLVFNFEIDNKALLDYCLSPALRFSFFGEFSYNCILLFHALFLHPFGISKPKLKPKYPFVATLVSTGGIKYIDPGDSSQSTLEEFLSQPDSVSFLDEAGIFLNTRDFQKTPKKLLFNLATSRHLGIDFIYTAQFDEQIDKQFRMLTQRFIHCASLAFWNSASRRAEISMYNIHYFRSASYWQWASNWKIRSNYFKTRLFWADLTISHPLLPVEKKVFKIYNSFHVYGNNQKKEKNLDIATLNKYPIINHR